MPPPEEGGARYWCQSLLSAMVSFGRCLYHLLSWTWHELAKSGRMMQGAQIIRVPLDTRLPCFANQVENNNNAVFCAKFLGHMGLKNPTSLEAKARLPNTAML